MKKIFIIPALYILFAASCERAPYHPALKSGDWPQYRADAGRTGFTPEGLPSNLSLKWKLEQAAPVPAWKGIHTRMIYDYAYQPVIGGKILYFGSSADCKVYALETSTGKERWSFFTGAPVRFAPALWKDRVYVVSDDGYLYCLSSKKGEVQWKKRGGPDDSKVLGNDRMISKWPARGGVVIKDNVLYFGAGIWPTDGIYIYALDPGTGRELWVNDNSGGMEYKQPHGGAVAKSGISSQGYLAAAGNNLFVPTGRSVPAALDLSSGEFKYFHLQKHRSYGGSRVSATDSYLFATSGNTRFFTETIGRSNALFNNEDGELVTTDNLNSPAMAINSGNIFYVDSNDRELKAFDLANLIIEKEVKDRKGETVIQKNISPPLWTQKTSEPETVSMIAAGNKIVYGSINNKVTVIDAGKRSVVWSAEVDGVPYGLAAAHSRLYVSTDRGTIYCFDGSASKSPRIITKELDNLPYGSNDTYARAAEEIIKKTGITEGYCLDIGCGDGRLAYELARRTNLIIYAVDSDPNKVESARKKLNKAGLYGSRVTVHHGDPSDTSYPEYFANLIVSGRSVSGGQDVFNAEEAHRIQRPSGGVICTGKPGAMEIRIREKLDGAGDWTHLYSDPANTINSRDELVRGPLGMLWFRDSDFEVPSRHGRGVAPLYSDGRLFVQGNHGIRAYDAYNGHILWEYHIDDLMKAYDQEHLNGVAITNSNWCIEGDRLYVRVSQQQSTETFRYCHVLDVKTGNRITRFPVPPNPDGKPMRSYGESSGYWGYLAVENSTIFGTIVEAEHITKWAYLESNMSNLYSESRALFAMDAKTGKLKWRYAAENAIRHNSIAIGNGVVYFIDRKIPVSDYLYSGTGGSGSYYEGPMAHSAGKLVALDAETGKVLYVKRNNIYGTLLALSTEHDVLLMTYQYTRFRLPSEKGGKMTAFRASDGRHLWDVDTGKYRKPGYGSLARLIINDRTIYFEPGAFDLLTGKRLGFEMHRYYGCGIISSSKNMMLFRSGTMGYIDLTAPQDGTQNYGGIRPGCWINTLPAGGLVLMPDATARCDCSYLIKATIALRPIK